MCPGRWNCLFPHFFYLRVVSSILWLTWLVYIYSCISYHHHFLDSSFLLRLSDVQHVIHSTSTILLCTWLYFLSWFSFYFIGPYEFYVTKPVVFLLSARYSAINFRYKFCCSIIGKRDAFGKWYTVFVTIN